MERRIGAPTKLPDYRLPLLQTVSVLAQSEIEKKIDNKEKCISIRIKRKTINTQNSGEKFGRKLYHESSLGALLLWSISNTICCL